MSLFLWKIHLFFNISLELQTLHSLYSLSIQAAILSDGLDTEAISEDINSTEMNELKDMSLTV